MCPGARCADSNLGFRGVALSDPTESDPAESDPPESAAPEPIDLLAATRLLESAAGGDSGAAEELVPHVYSQLRALAGGIFRQQAPDHTLQPTALVHEAYLRLVDAEQVDWKSQSHFKAVASKAMRQILIDHHRRRNAAKRGGDWERCTLSGLGNDLPQEDVEFLALHEALTQLQELDERQARVVELRFFSGLNMEEIAHVLEVSKTTVEGEWRHARAWLSRQLRETSE